MPQIARWFQGGPERNLLRFSFLVFAALTIIQPAPCSGQAWAPSPGHQQIPLWPRGAPNAQPLKGPEVAGTVVDSAGRPRLVGGKPWVYVNNVSQPTMT